MTSNFRLKGMNKTRGRQFTLELLETDKHTFWADPLDMTDEKFLQLFNWAKSTDDFWKDKWIAVCEHEGFFEDGTPRKPQVLYIQAETK